jgi:spore maturation protein CgeB
MGIKLANFSTDDPWSKGQFASWFMKALPSYDYVFTPRQANFEDLKSLNGPEIHPLPFAYAPDLHFPAQDDESPKTMDVLFYGNVDPDRSPQLEALVSSGLRLTLYAASRLTPRLIPSFHGYADPATMRRAVAQAPVSLVIGRKSNRDTHAMRSYEIPAMRGCILAEDSKDHRLLYGDSAHYFNDIPSLIASALNLVHSAPLQRQHLRDSILRKVISGRNTYGDRLDKILTQCGAKDGWK